MARTLKSTGFMANCLWCVAVEDDGSTVREFVSADVNSNKTYTDATPTCTARTWNGTSVYGFKGTRIAFAAGHRPAGADPGTVLFMSWATTRAVNSDDSLLGGTGSFPPHIRGLGAGTLALWYGTGEQEAVTVSAPGSGAKFTVAFVYERTATPNTNLSYYGVEAGTLALDNTESSPNVVSGNAAVEGLYGYTGGPGWQAYGGASLVDCIVAAQWSSKLSLSDLQSIHDDPYGALFESGASAEGGGMLLGSRRNRLTIP